MQGSGQEDFASCLTIQRLARENSSMEHPESAIPPPSDFYSGKLFTKIVKLFLNFFFPFGSVCTVLFEFEFEPSVYHFTMNHYA